MIKHALKFVLAATFTVGALAAHAEKLSVAATPVPHAELLEFVMPTLAKEGVELEIRVFTDYVQPNLQVAQKQLDANFFQHKPYLDEFNKARGTDLVQVGLVHVEPFGAYSRKVKSVEELATGATVAIPNDPTNGGRALLLLARQGLITLKNPEDILASARDVVENPKKLKFRELEAATLPRVLDQVDLVLINTNYALEAGLNPTKDALFIEGADSPYANILVTRKENAESASVQKLLQALQSDATRRFINDRYKGAIVPAF